MIAISVGYGSYSCGRYRKRASGRNDAEMDCRTEIKNLSAVGKPTGEIFFFDICSMLSYIAGCMQRPVSESEPYRLCCTLRMYASCSSGLFAGSISSGNSASMVDTSGL